MYNKVIVIQHQTAQELNKILDSVLYHLKYNRCKIISVQYGGATSADDGIVYSLMIHMEVLCDYEQIPTAVLASKEIQEEELNELRKGRQKT